jgi:hypothetical protein
MENKPETASRFVCDLTAMNADQRKQYQGVMEQLNKTVQGVEELQNGYVFRYNADSSTVLLIAEFISLERLCCPFLDFTLIVEHEGGPVWLRLTGSEGVKQFLRAELSFD